MKPPGATAASLGRRLSGLLALQTFVALTLVSASVYGVNAWNLAVRQHDALEQISAVVQHALLEAATEGMQPELKHKLDHFLAGQADVSLTLLAAPGQPIYFVQGSRSGGAQRRSHFRMPWTPSPTGEVQGELVFDTGADQQLLRRLAITLMAAVVIGASLVSVSGFWIVRRGLDPVRGLSRQLQAMSPDQAGLRLDGATQPLELQPLVAQFNSLLGRVERAYAQLEGFNADVAHELRTPLTTLIGASELALHRERPIAELREVIASNLEDLRRLAGIVGDMLFLSRADRGARARREPVASLASLAGEVIDYHDAQVQEAGLQPLLRGDARGAFDATLLRRAVSNLLSNATRYANPGSTIIVQVTASTPSRVRLAVCNEGPTIAAEHLPRLFDRFYRAEAARQGGDENRGLGLAIVAAIARMHGGTTFAESSNGRTTVGLEIDAA